jgi:hypothetical protein
LREYARLEDGSDGMPTLDLDEMHAQLQGKIAQERGFAGWLRSRPTPLRATLAGLAVGLLVVMTMAVWLRADFDVYPAFRMRAMLAWIAGLLVLDLVLVLWPLQLPAAPRWLTMAAIVGAPISLFLWYGGPPAHTDHPRSVPPETVSSFVGHAASCLAVGTIVAGGFYALLRALDRGGTNRLLLMAACAGLSANLLLQLHCAVTTPAHLVTGHLGVLAICFGVAAWLERARQTPARG